MKDKILRLLEESDMHEKLRQTIPLKGGGNNRVFRLNFDNSPSLICKHYFQHPDDVRPRLLSEFSFLTYAWNLGLRCIPRPILCNAEHNLALYSFIPGAKVTPQDINYSIIQDVIDFFFTLNRNKNQGTRLPAASESCLSLGDFQVTVERKIASLLSTPENTPLQRDVHQFIKHSLIPKWKHIKSTIIHHDLNKITPQHDLCITPSDFGFHNTLLDHPNKLYFLDFEYAGWDDLTKTTCDFFCQPQVPIPKHYYDQLKTAFVSLTSNPEAYLKRVNDMMPVCQIKWCCIILNVFHKTGIDRRVFSDPLYMDKQEQQLNLAKGYLENVLY